MHHKNVIYKQNEKNNLETTLDPDQESLGESKLISLTKALKVYKREQKYFIVVGVFLHPEPNALEEYELVHIFIRI